MILTPFLRSRGCPRVISCIRQIRSSPSIKIGKDRFELNLDVRNFDKDEITVKAHPNYVTIEAKKEVKSSKGCFISQIMKRYRLPEGCKIKEMESRLYPDGTLKVSAPRSCGEPDVCDTVIVPIQTGDPPRRKAIAPDVQQKPAEVSNPCANYKKVKPKPPRS